MARAVMLTTKDNPYDPSVDFDKWLYMDMQLGYNTCGYLARVAHTSSLFSEKLNNQLTEQAIDDIIRYDPFDVYRKVVVNS